MLALKHFFPARRYAPFDRIKLAEGAFQHAFELFRGAMNRLLKRGCQMRDRQRMQAGRPRFEHSFSFRCA